MSCFNRKMFDLLTSVGVHQIIAIALIILGIYLITSPGLKQAIGRKIVQNMADLSMYTAYLVMVLFCIMVTAIQANQLFCSMVNGKFEILSELEAKWQRVFGIYLLVMVGLFNITCACILKYFVTQIWNFVATQVKTKPVKKRSNTQRYAKTLEWLHTDLDQMMVDWRRNERKITRHGTAY